MYIERKQDLSFYYFVKGLFSDAPFVTVVDGFPEGEITFPTVSVDNQRIETYDFELGNKTRQQVRTWVIDIYALNKSQRDDFSYRILNALEGSIPIYNYDEGFPPDTSPSQVGCYLPNQIEVNLYKIDTDQTNKLYWRAFIFYTGEYSYLE